MACLTNRQRRKFATGPSDPPLEKPKPGHVLAQVIQRAEPWEHPLILERLERKYLVEGNLELLREVRAYRRMLMEQAKPPRAK